MPRRGALDIAFCCCLSLCCFFERSACGWIVELKVTVCEARESNIWRISKGNIRKYSIEFRLYLERCVLVSVCFMNAQPVARASPLYRRFRSAPPAVIHDEPPSATPESSFDDLSMTTFVWQKESFCHLFCHRLTCWFRAHYAKVTVVEVFL
jgi:hypothetical protein